MKMQRLWRSIMVLTMAFASQQVLASDTGNIVGSLSNTTGSNYTMTARDPATGRSLTVTADSNGSFRFSRLPIGTYEITVSENGNVVARDTKYVSLNSNVPVRFVFDDSIEEIITTAQAISADTYSTDSGLVLNNEQIEILPVARNLTAVSMLAPGTVLGDSRFSLSNGSNGLVSFGGSSVAENSCYINGLEVTNTRQGLGCGSVPFEFYKEFQVKTGGYSAQYGRTTGGVLNAVTKSGTNEWEFSTGIQFQPATWYEGGKKSFSNNGSGNVFRDTSDDSYGESSLILTAGGPLIKDRLFFYGIVEQRDTEQNFSDNTGREAYSPDDEYRKVTADGSDNLFWGTKIDWDITDNHQLSAFGYSNRSDATDVHYARNPNTGVRSSTSTGSFLRKRGGEAYKLQLHRSLHRQPDGFCHVRQYPDGICQRSDQHYVPAGYRLARQSVSRWLRTGRKYWREQRRQYAVPLRCRICDRQSRHPRRHRQAGTRFDTCRCTDRWYLRHRLQHVCAGREYRYQQHLDVHQQHGCGAGLRVAAYLCRWRLVFQRA